MHLESLPVYHDTELTGKMPHKFQSTSNPAFCSKETYMSFFNESEKHKLYLFLSNLGTKSDTYVLNLQRMRQTV